jgi:DNA-binding transcriptional LysR family regulator
VRGKLSLGKFCKLKQVATFYPGVGPGLVDRLLAERGYKRNVTLSLPHWLSVPFAVAQSDLIATVRAAVARMTGPYLRLQRLRCPVTIPRLPVSLVWHIRTQDSGAHRWFRELVINVWNKNKSVERSS